MVLVAIAMVAIIAIAALSIDVITLYLAKEEAQRSADNAALAAAKIISLSGLTADPANNNGNWGKICGPDDGTNGIATRDCQSRRRDRTQSEGQLQELSTYVMPRVGGTAGAGNGRLQHPFSDGIRCESRRLR